MPVRHLQPADEPLVDAFLRPRVESSMLLLSNKAQAGIVDGDDYLQGMWLGAFADDAPDELTGVAVHCWNQNVLLQAPGAALAPLADELARRARRPLGGMVGPWEQVSAMRARLGLDDTPTKLLSREILFALALDELQVPPALADGRLVCRHAQPADRDLLVAWYVGYSCELLGDRPGPHLERQCVERVERRTADGMQFVLEAADRPVAATSFNSWLPDCVQVGGVWTPPELRGHGYARAAVAGSLLEMRGRAVTRSVLFTGDENVPAIRAYQALGYRPIGTYGLLGFTHSVSLEDTR